jgi:hypothetical protein
MTYNEARAVLNVLFVAYPATYRDWKKDQYKYLTALYAETFKNVPAGVVAKAIKRILATNRTNFAPSIGEVVYRVKELISVYDPDSAWEDVCYIVRVVDFENIPSALKGLDDIAQKIVTSRDIQRMKESSKELSSFKYTFISAYNKEKDKKESAAVDSGDLMSISSKERVLQISRYKAPDLQIEMDQESEDKQ